MEILVRFNTCCGINMRTYLRTFLWSEMPNGKIKKKIGTFLLYSYFFLYRSYTISNSSIIAGALFFLKIRNLIRSGSATLNGSQKLKMEDRIKIRSSLIILYFISILMCLFVLPTSNV